MIIGSLLFSYGTADIYDVSNSGWQHRIRGNGTAIVNVASGGVDIQSGNVLKVAGTQVVSTRQTATPANATVITLVKDLETKLVAHGLIS